jgi:tetratricopeptide (TPR) repeat protein
MKSQKKSCNTPLLAAGSFILNEYEEAIKKYNQALDINSDHVLFSYNIALVYWRQGAYKEARKRWHSATKIYEGLPSKVDQDKNADLFFIYGAILENLNELDRAEKQYKKGLEIDPKNIDILITLVDIYLNKKEQELDDSSPSYWVKARQYYLKARNLLKDESNNNDSANTSQASP